MKQGAGKMKRKQGSQNTKNGREAEEQSSFEQKIRKTKIRLKGNKQFNKESSDTVIYRKKQEANQLLSITKGKTEKTELGQAVKTK